MTFGDTLRAAAGFLLASLATANQASACILGILLCGGDSVGGGGAAAPEFDGPGAVAAASLLVSIGLVLYNRARR